MKVNIRQDAETFTKTHGVIFKKRETFPYYRVRCSIELSEEERAIAAEYNLWDRTAFTYPYNPPSGLDGLDVIHHLIGDTVEYPLRQFVEDCVAIDFGTPVEAAEFIERLRTHDLPQIKRYFEATAQVSLTSNTTFEL